MSWRPPPSGPGLEEASVGKVAGRIGPSKLSHVDSPCFCGELDAFLEDPTRDEIYCRSCGFRLSRQTILHGPVAMHNSFVLFRAREDEARAQEADPQGLLPHHYRYPIDPVDG